MADIEGLRRVLVARLLDGEGRATKELRRAAFDRRAVPEALQALVGTVAERATATTDAHFAAARASGLTEDQLFELVVCAAVGAATRETDQALAALGQAQKERG